MTALMLMNYTKGLVDAFTFVILLATLTTLVPYAFSAAAQAWLWLVEGEAFNAKHLVRDVVDRDARLRLQRVGDRRRRRRHRDQGLRAPALRHPGLHRHALVAGRAKRVDALRSVVPPAVAGDGDAAAPLTTTGASESARHRPPRPPACYVGSEVGVLRRVILHRPDLELKRLTPRNKDELLFDDVLWVKRARQEHDAFADTLAERGVEVLYLARAAGRDARRCRRRAPEVLDAHDRRGRRSGRRSARRCASGSPTLPADRARRRG